MTTHDQTADDEAPAEPGGVLVDDAHDPAVTTLAAAMDPPGPGRRAVQRVAAVPIEAWISLAVVAACVARSIRWAKSSVVNCCVDTGSC